jgi:para-aminobenzoate synthetase component 1
LTVGIRVEEFPYRADSAALFAPLAGRPWAVLLDSGRPACTAGRWDILACEPRVILTTRAGITEVRSGATRLLSPDDPLDLLRRHLAPLMDPVDGLPFPGGAIGYFAYDLGRRFERLPATARDPLGLPEMAVGIYDWALLVDHEDRRTRLVGASDRSGSARRLLAAAARGALPVPKRAFAVHGPVRSNLDAAAYAERFRRVQGYIREGDCYQINLARRFAVTAEGDPWDAYLALRRLSPAPFAAYLDTPMARVLSSSPERFLRLRGGEVETCPIKGTRPRGRTPEEDERRRSELTASAKDRAENLMIVDLLRNDLGRTCATGSIRVPDLFAVESFANVHHLVSRILGRLGPGRDALDLLRGCFPGGSITGAPKIRAMEIIEELEGERRSLYCGSIGYLGFDGAMDTNIAIRTLVHARNALWFWAGGGIVADSRCAEEAAEIEVKAVAMRAAVEAFRSLVATGKGG